MTAGPCASERPFCGCDVLCLLHSEILRGKPTQSRFISCWHASKLLSESMPNSESDKWKAPDDASSNEEDAGPYFPYHHEQLASEWLSSSESEDGPTTSSWSESKIYMMRSSLRSTAGQGWQTITTSSEN